MILGIDDEPALLAYLDASPDDTMWLRSAWFDGGARFAAQCQGERIVAVAAHAPNGVIHVHASHALAELARECRRPEWPIVALAGPAEQVAAARVALDVAARAVTRTSRETIMALELEGLEVPELLTSGRGLCRRARVDELPLLIDWRARYFREVHGITIGDEAVVEMRHHLSKGHLWVLEDSGVVVNTVSFSAVFARLVQLEYAYSPPELRSKSYGRSGAAGALISAHAEGVRRAVLYTDEKNVATQTAVHRIGFRVTGAYVVVLFA